MKPKEKAKELEEALLITLDEEGTPTDEQLKNASKKWRDAVDDPYRMFADKDFLAGAVWGVQLILGKVKK